MVQRGQVIRVDEEHYRYGAGPLRLRVTGVGRTFKDAAGEWVRLRGWVLYYQDHIDERGGPQTFDVRVSALPPDPPAPDPPPPDG